MHTDTSHTDSNHTDPSAAPIDTDRIGEDVASTVPVVGGAARGESISVETASVETASVGTASVGPARAVEPKIFDELLAVARDEGCELLHVGRHGNALQLVIDHVEGVTLDHCSAISRQSGALLDGLDYGRGRYVLEVSSPGLDREFYQLSDFETFLGSKVKVVHRNNGHKVTVRGTLTDFDPESARIEVLQDGSETAVQLNVRDIQTTRLEIDI